ncbi:MAG: outer membrane beta-barrel protein [Bacteroidales bacterium]|nr:outer membrane beta-barrel protein [Bacteroidales bacterium]
MKRIFILCGFIVAVTAGVTTAEGQRTPEYSVYLGGGVSTLRYQPETGDKRFWNGGGLLGIGFNYLFTSRFGFVTGAEISSYSATVTAGNATCSYATSDPQGVPFVLNSVVSHFREKQQVVLLNVPIMFQYQHGKGLHKFYIAGGGKIGVFSVLSRYSNDGATLQTSGEFDSERQFSDEAMQELGFGDFTAPALSGNFPVQPCVTASVETGMRWRFNKNTRLYTGIYFDFGLTEIRRKKENAPMVRYHSDTRNYTINSAIATADKVTPLAAGIIVRFAFGPNQTRGRAVSSPDIFMKAPTRGSKKPK